MGNQQERSLAWLAGIIDGEGSVSAQVYTMPNGRVRITPFVSITNTDVGIVQECRSILDSIGVVHRTNSVPKEGCGFKGNLPCVSIRIDGQKPVRQLLRIVGNYLKSQKRARAAAILEFIESRSARGVQRNERGHCRRVEYSRQEIELIASVRTHKRAKSSETICQAPNII